MNVARPIRLADDSSPAEEVEGDIRGLVRREVASYRRAGEPTGESIANEVHSLLERVSASSVQELDKLIGELQSLREFLDNESQRIQREIADYVHLADAAVKSTKLVAEQLISKSCSEHPSLS